MAATSMEERVPKRRLRRPKARKRRGVLAKLSLRNMSSIRAISLAILVVIMAFLIIKGL